jgi:DNA modification methylase
VEATPLKRTQTQTFGTSRREAHDATAFYSRNLYAAGAAFLTVPALDLPPARPPVAPRPRASWANRVYCHTAADMWELPDESVGLAFTSPPYNAGKDFDEDLSLGDYLSLIAAVGREVWRVLVPGGRYVVNVANLGRKPYIPMHAYFYAVHAALGFLPAGEVVWRKGRGMSSSCAWGSWRSARAPRLRDLHEYLIVFAKGRYERPDRGESDLSPEEFMAATLSVWEIPPERARKVGHPAPFPVALAERVIRLYSYRTDVVLDPFNGSGTTCLAAAQLGRAYVGYDIDPGYCALAEARLRETAGTREAGSAAPSASEDTGATAHHG